MLESDSNHLSEKVAFECACRYSGHLLILSYYPNDEGDLYAEVMLPRYRLLHRLWIALKYVFGKQEPIHDMLFHFREWLHMKDWLSENADKESEYRRTKSES